MNILTIYTYYGNIYFADMHEHIYTTLGIIVYTPHSVVFSVFPGFIFCVVHIEWSGKKKIEEKHFL